MDRLTWPLSHNKHAHRRSSRKHFGRTGRVSTASINGRPPRRLHTYLRTYPHKPARNSTAPSMFLHLFIISRSGGLIYNKDLSPSAPKLSVNGWLIMGSTFHGLHSIAAQVCRYIHAWRLASIGRSIDRSIEPALNFATGQRPTPPIYIYTYKQTGGAPGLLRDREAGVRQPKAAVLPEPHGRQVRADGRAGDAGPG